MTFYRLRKTEDDEIYDDFPNEESARQYILQHDITEKDGYELLKMSTRPDKEDTDVVMSFDFNGNIPSRVVIKTKTDPGFTAVVAVIRDLK